MKYLHWLCLLLVVAIPALGQDRISIDVGASGGVPLAHTLRSTFCCTTATAFVSIQTNDASYTMGLTGGAVLRDRIHISFSAMYMPVSFRSIGTTCCPLAHPIYNRHGTSWEFPLLADFRWLKGSLRPFSGGGMMLVNRTSAGENQSPAPVVSGGVEWLRHGWVVRPEFRYTHFPESFGSNISVGCPSNQAQLLLGILYRVPLSR